MGLKRTDEFRADLLKQELDVHEDAIGGLP